MIKRMLQGLMAMVFTLLASGQCPALGLSEVLVLGFSPDGKYAAYETEFNNAKTDGHRFVFAVVDIDHNRFVKVFKARSAGNSIMRWNSKIEAKREQGRKLMHRYGITFDEKGEQVYHLKTEINQVPPAVRKVTFEYAPLPDGYPQLHTLTLKEKSINPGNYDASLQHVIDLRIFDLKIECLGKEHYLQQDKKLYRSRQEPYAYGIYSVYAYQDKIVVFLNAYTLGEDGPNVYKLVVTGKLP